MKRKQISHGFPENFTQFPHGFPLIAVTANYDLAATYELRAVKARYLKSVNLSWRMIGIYTVLLVYVVDFVTDAEQNEVLLL